MNQRVPYQLFADVVLAIHFAIVAFVVGGLIYILVGRWRGWRSSRSLGFRVAHLAAIAIVVAQAWLGAICPLTTLEMWLREQARQTTYSGSFIEHWLRRLVYFDAPSWVFTVAYTVFGFIVLVTWWHVPPRRKPRARG